MEWRHVQSRLTGRSLTERAGCPQGEDWEEGFANGLLRSLCFFPLLSYGSTAPLASLPADAELALAAGWDEAPVGRARLRGEEGDPDDNVLKEFLIAVALLESRSAAEANAEGTGGAGGGQKKVDEGDGNSGDAPKEGDCGQLQVFEKSLACDFSALVILSSCSRAS